MKKRREALGKDSQAPPLLRQRKLYLTGSPPSRQVRRCRQNLSHRTIITPRSLWANIGKCIQLWIVCCRPQGCWKQLCWKKVLRLGQDRTYRKIAFFGSDALDFLA